MENLKNLNLPVKFPDFNKLKEQLKPVTLSNNISQLVNRFTPASSSTNTKDEENDDIEQPSKKKQSTLKRQNATKRSDENRPEARPQNPPIGISTISSGITIPQSLHHPEPAKNKFLSNFSLPSLKNDRIASTTGIILSIPMKLIKKEKVNTKKNKNEETKTKPSKKDIVHEHFYPRNSFDDFDSDFDDDLDDFEEEILTVEVENSQHISINKAIVPPKTPTVLPNVPVVPPRRRKSLHNLKDVPSKRPAPEIPSSRGVVKNDSALYKNTQPVQSLCNPHFVPSLPKDPPVQSRVKNLKSTVQNSSDTSFEDFARSRSKQISEPLNIFNKAQTDDVFQEFDDIFHNGPPTQDSLPIKTIHKASTVSDLRLAGEANHGNEATEIKQKKEVTIKQLKSIENKKSVTMDEKVRIMKKTIVSSNSSSFSSSFEDNLQKARRNVMQRRPSTSITIQDYRHDVDAIPRCKSIISPKHEEDFTTVQSSLKTKSEPNLPELTSPMLIMNSVDGMKKQTTSIFKKSTTEKALTKSESIKTRLAITKSFSKPDSLMENKKNEEDKESGVISKPKLTQFSTFSIEAPQSSIALDTLPKIPTIYPSSWSNTNSIISPAVLPKPYRSTILSSISHAPKAKLPKAADSYLKQIQTVSFPAPNNQHTTTQFATTISKSKLLQLDVTKLSREHLVSSSNFQSVGHEQPHKSLSSSTVRKTFIYYNDQDQVNMNLAPKLEGIFI